MNIWQKLFSRKSLNRNTGRAFVILALLLFISFSVSLLLGSTRASALEALGAALDGQLSNGAYRIMVHVRLPRCCAAVLAGSALAVAGVIIQAVLNNAMAAPNIIGVNAGAGLAVTLLFALAPGAAAFVPFAAFFGALAACLCIYAIARHTGASRMTITLVGITISSILTAGINLVKTIFPDSIYNTHGFLVGGIAGVSMAKLSPACWLIGLGLLVSLLLAREMDVLSLG